MLGWTCLQGFHLFFLFSSSFYPSVVFFILVFIYQYWHIVKQATFKITLEVPTDLVALSNMPITEEKVNGNLKIVSYQESPIMSTYLVAIVVGLFDYVEDHTSDGKTILSIIISCLVNSRSSKSSFFFCSGIKVRVYCQVGKADQGKFALHVGAKTLDLFKE